MAQRRMRPDRWYILRHNTETPYGGAKWMLARNGIRVATSTTYAGILKAAAVWIGRMK